jgi:hypothetical protein
MKPRAIVVAFAIALSLAGCSGGGGPSAAPTPADNIFALTLGDCFDDLSGLDSGTGSVEAKSVQLVDCADSHQLEIYSQSTLDGDVFPGDDSAASQADDACFTAFEAFAGAPFDTAVDFNYKTLYPTEASWATGDREVLCAIAQVDGEQILPTTGSLKGAAAQLQ